MAGLLAVAAAVLVFVLRPPDAVAPQAREASPSLAPSITQTVHEVGETVLRRPETKPTPRTKTKPVEPTPPPEPAVEPPAGEPERSRRGKKPAPPSADQMLREAQRVLGTGNTDGAHALYLRLIKTHPGTAEARTSLVSVGRIELRRGKAKAALRHFDQYLAASAGPLREEARYGRIRALRRLGRHEQELRSIESFLSDHPGSVYAARLEARAKQLRGE